MNLDPETEEGRHNLAVRHEIVLLCVLSLTTVEHVATALQLGGFPPVSPRDAHNLAQSVRERALRGLVRHKAWRELPK